MGQWDEKQVLTRKEAPLWDELLLGVGGQQVRRLGIEHLEAYAERLLSLNQ